MCIPCIYNSEYMAKGLRVGSLRKWEKMEKMDN
jgi:hypothetical protein